MTHPSHPRLSIAIPSYNGSATIAEAIASCLAQSWGEFELVIVDDASSDSTATVVRGVVDRRMRWECNASNFGAIANWNRCIGATRGEYLLILHQDDWLFPGALEQLATSIASNPSAGLISLRGALRTDRRPGDEVARAGSTESRTFPAGIEAIREFMRSGTLCSAVVVRRIAYEQLGRFNTAFPYSADEEMWPRLCRRWPVVIQNAPWVGVRVGGKHLMHRTWAEPDFWAQWVSIHETILGYATECSTNAAQVSTFRDLLNRRLVDSAHYIARHFIAADEPAMARAYLERATSREAARLRPDMHWRLMWALRLPRFLSRMWFEPRTMQITA